MRQRPRRLDAGGADDEEGPYPLRTMLDRQRVGDRRVRGRSLELRRSEATRMTRGGGDMRPWRRRRPPRSEQAEGDPSRGRRGRAAHRDRPARAGRGEAESLGGKTTIEAMVLAHQTRQRSLCSSRSKPNAASAGHNSRAASRHDVKFDESSTETTVPVGRSDPSPHSIRQNGLFKAFSEVERAGLEPATPACKAKRG